MVILATYSSQLLQLHVFGLDDSSQSLNLLQSQCFFRLELNYLTSEFTAIRCLIPQVSILPSQLLELRTDFKRFSLPFVFDQFGTLRLVSQLSVEHLNLLIQ